MSEEEVNEIVARWERYLQENNLDEYVPTYIVHNTRLIPRSIAEILLHSDLKEFHISLTQGLWRYESWGYPIVDNAPGAEAWAWFAGGNLTDTLVDEQWNSVTSTFSGILCASLNFMDKTNTITPKYGFQPQFVGGCAHRNVNKYLRYSSLPREIVCTENLTPWKKLLPCSSKIGFASLLNSGNIHNTNYHSLAIKFRTLCNAKEECVLEFIESANLVYDPKLLGAANEYDFSLRRMFGQGLNGYCPLADTSKIYVNLKTPLPYEMTPLPHYNITSTRGGYATQYGVYDFQESKESRLFNIAWVLQKAKNTVLIPFPPQLLTHRYVVGYGQEKGKVITLLNNTQYNELPIILQENIPWYMPIYVHTLKIRNRQTGQIIAPKTVKYRPGRQRERPYYLEMAFKLPGKTSVEISFDFDYIFLKWLEYPPDANHGHYVGSAVVTTQMSIARNYSSIPLSGHRFADSFNASRNSYILTLRTESLILSLPTPDFSMPYNVICLACTVVALAFGPIHSVATKRIIIEEQDPGANQTLVSRIFRKIYSTKNQNNTSSHKDVTILSENDKMCEKIEKVSC